MVIKKIPDNNQGSRWGMIYKKYEWTSHTYKEKAIEENGANQRIQNQGNDNEG